MKPTSIRLKQNSTEMLAELSDKTTTAAQTVIDLFTHLRRTTIIELKGIFNPQEIIAMAHIHHGLNPVWQIMCNTSAIITNTVNAEKYSASISMYGADVDAIVKKLSALNTAQATILQLELISFWNRENPDLEQLIKALS